MNAPQKNIPSVIFYFVSAYDSIKQFFEGGLLVENKSFMPLADEATVTRHKQIYDSLLLDLKIAADGHSALRGASAEEICRSLFAAKGRRGKELEPIFKAAAAVWCHTLYFENLLPTEEIPPVPEAETCTPLIKSFGSMGNFFYLVRTVSGSTSAPGFLWMYKTRDGELGLSRLPLYTLPDLRETDPLLCIDLWEHAYMYRWGSDISGYADACLRQINWKRIFGKEA